jgi:hypothetical protein
MSQNNKQREKKEKESNYERNFMDDLGLIGGEMIRHECCSSVKDIFLLFCRKVSDLEL